CLRSRPRALIFLAALFIYNANLRSIGAGDTVPAALFPFAAVVDHTVTFDRYEPYCSAHVSPGTYFFRRGRNGRAYSLYPIALPLLLTPLYAPFILASGARSWPTRKIVEVALCVEKIPASLIAALSAALLFGLLRRLLGPRSALVLTVVFALGTESWMISSQALWQHGGSALAVIASLDRISLAAGERRLAQLALAGLFAGLSVAIRPTNAAFLAVSSVVLFAPALRDVRGILAYSAGPAVVGALVAAYNQAAFGDLRGGYGVPGVVGYAFMTPFLAGLANLLVSPSRGLLVYCPVLIFSLVGVVAWCRAKDRLCPPVYLISGATALAYLVSFSKWTLWWGGHTYGPRYFTDVGPCLVVLMAPAVGLIRRHPALRGLFALTLAASIAAQALGAFCYPNGDWNGRPEPVDSHRDRLWDWRDNQIRRTLAGGVVGDPLARLRSALEPTPEELDARFEALPRRLFALEGDWPSRSRLLSAVASAGADGVTLTASGDDPQVILPAFDFPARAPVVLRVDLTAPADTVLQVFWATAAAPDYAEARSLVAPLRKGRSRVCLELPGGDLAGRLRLDPGTVPGAYTLHSLEARSE
ncbi:MAG TPA: hypothetical protein VHF22_12110, partial [Planctomycetota bacterium]|nr:hypothetical protein [Planctomycetota bacterium]